MDKELEQLEAELQALRPAELPAQLEEAVLARIDTADSGPSKVVRGPWLSRPLVAAAAVAIAAVGVFFAILNSFGPRPDRGPSLAGAGASELAAGDTTPARPTFVALRAENVFEGADDEGIFLGKDNVPMRQLRYHFTDSLILQNPEDGSELQVTLPREHVYLVPAKTD